MSIPETTIKNIVEEAVLKAIGNIQLGVTDNTPMTFKEAMEYLGYSKSHGYKLTSANQIPYSKRGKRLFFSKTELDQWLLSSKVKTAKQIDKEAADLLNSKKLRRRKSKQNLGFRKGDLDTLEQRGTQHADKQYSENTQTLFGKGSSMQSITNRSKRKYVSQNLALKLVDVAKEEGSSLWEKRYWTTYHCQNDLTLYEGRTYGTYCRRRWCTACAAIRKAEMIIKYLPVMQEWSEMHFLTLTVKSKPKQSLQKWIDGMFRAFDKILRKCRRKYKNGTGPKLIGIRCLECNYNPIKKWYNPHFHLLIPNKEISDLIKKEWCALWNRRYEKSRNWKRDMLAAPRLQVNVKVKNTIKDYIEVIKYGAKVFTDPEMKKGESGKWKVYAAALHEIYKAFENRRLISSFGIDMPTAELNKTETKEVTGTQKIVYDKRLKDWIDTDTGELLTGYVPTGKLDYLINQCMNTEQN